MSDADPLQDRQHAALVHPLPWTKTGNERGESTGRGEKKRENRNIQTRLLLAIVRVYKRYLLT